MIDDNEDNDPTLFIRKSQSNKSIFSGNTMRPVQMEGRVPEIDNTFTMAGDRIVREKPTLQLDDKFDTLIDNASNVFKNNIGIAFASPIFFSLFQIDTNKDVDPDLLHQQFSDMLRHYEAELSRSGLSEKRIRLMLYGVAATVDDIILQKDWAFESKWSQESMISQFFKETWGGERFFNLLKEMMNAPSSFIREMELFYLCLQFGFEGRYRLSPRATELMQVRDDLYHLVRDAWGNLPYDLSPSWKGVVALNPQTRPLKNVWYWMLLTSLIVALAYLIMANYLNRETQVATKNIDNLMNNPVIIKEQVEASPQPVPQKNIPNKNSVSVDTTLARLSNWQKSGEIKISNDKNKIIISTTKELFSSASTTLRSPYAEILPEVAKTLNDLSGQIEVVGYTDNVPIHTSKYSDNLALSQARAHAVADLIALSLDNPSRISSKGMGSNDPIAPNDTSEGRLANRRVEIILTLP